MKRLVHFFLMLSLISLIYKNTSTVSSSSYRAPLQNTEIELLPYQAMDYRYQVISSSANPPSGFEQPGYDDSGWSTGQAAFGSGGWCALQKNDHTKWPVLTKLLLRRTLSIPANMTNLKILVSVDNDLVAAYFNGTLISGRIAHGGCPSVDNFAVDVPQSLIQQGDNVLALVVQDLGAESFFDMRIVANDTTERLWLPVVYKP